MGKHTLLSVDEPVEHRAKHRHGAAIKSVRARGVVTNSWGIPLVPFQLYNVDDGRGEITVLSRSGRTPARGTRVQVKGKVNEVAVFGGRSVGLHLQEEDRKIKS